MAQDCRNILIAVKIIGAPLTNLANPLNRQNASGLCLGSMPVLATYQFTYYPALKG
jgi:hypothetical protein